MLACAIDCEADVKCTEVRRQHSPCSTSRESAVEPNLEEERAQVSGKRTKEGLTVIVGGTYADIFNSFILHVGKYIYRDKNCEEEVIMWVFLVYSWQLISPGDQATPCVNAAPAGISRLAK